MTVLKVEKLIEGMSDVIQFQEKTIEDAVDDWTDKKVHDKIVKFHQSPVGKKLIIFIGANDKISVHTVEYNVPIYAIKVQPISTVKERKRIVLKWILAQDLEQLDNTIDRAIKVAKEKAEEAARIAAAKKILEEAPKITDSKKIEYNNYKYNNYKYDKEYYNNFKYNNNKTIKSLNYSKKDLYDLYR